MRSFINKAVLGAAALVSFGFVASAAHAQVPFGSFTSAAFGTNFVYDSVTNRFGSNSGAFGSIAVNFQFDVPVVGAPSLTGIPATLTFISNGGAVVNANSALPLSGVSMSIRRNSDNANLLSILAGGTGRLGSVTSINSNVIPVSGDTILGDTVVFSSDFINFAPTDQRVFALTTSTASPNYAIAGNNRPNTFAGSYVGSFSTAVVPEANTGLLAGLALPILGGVAVLRRRNK